MPKISVVMPNYNCEKYLKDAIESILNQTYTDFEFIIIDDGSIDNGWSIIQEYSQKDPRIVPVKNEQNLRICKTLNKGIALAKGEYIARMDSDDISELTRFEKQVAFLEANPDVAIVGGNMNIMDLDKNVYSKRTYNKTHDEIMSKIFRYSPFCHASTMYRTDAIRKAGGYNEFLHDAEDYDMYFRIGKYGKFANLDADLYYMRVNTAGVTFTKTKRMETLTLFIRLKAVLEYGYKMKFSDKIYSLLQFISMFLIPSRFKIWLFNLIRNSK